MCNKQEATRTEHASSLIALLEADPFVCASDSTVESRWKGAMDEADFLPGQILRFAGNDNRGDRLRD
jgi:hypothetical protein